jgi:hypothetical protein
LVREKDLIVMTKFKIKYLCVEEPASQSGLDGFRKGGIYEGRNFNGMYEVCSQWGRNKASKLISKPEFAKYFELIREEQTLAHTAVTA